MRKHIIAVSGYQPAQFIIGEKRTIMLIVEPDHARTVFYTGVSTQIVLMYMDRIRRSKLLPLTVGVIINGNFPFLTAGNGTGGGDAVKFVIIVRMNTFHVNMSSLLLNGNIIKETRFFFNRKGQSALEFTIFL